MASDAEGVTFDLSEISISQTGAGTCAVSPELEPQAGMHATGPLKLSCGRPNSSRGSCGSSDDFCNPTDHGGPNFWTSMIWHPWNGCHKAALRRGVQKDAVTGLFDRPLTFCSYGIAGCLLVLDSHLLLIPVGPD